MYNVVKLSCFLNFTCTMCVAKNYFFAASIINTLYYMVLPGHKKSEIICRHAHGGKQKNVTYCTDTFARVVSLKHVEKYDCEVWTLLCGENKIKN